MAMHEQQLGFAHCWTRLAIVLVVACLLVAGASARAAVSPTYIGVRAPTASEQQQAEQDFKTQYASENISNATPLAQTEFAQRVLIDAQQRRDNPAQYYVWKWNAASVLRRAGQWREALQLCDELSSDFNAPYFATRAPVVRDICREHIGRPLAGFSDVLALRMIYDTLEGCLAEDDYYNGATLVVVGKQYEAKLNRSGPLAYCDQFQDRLSKNEGAFLRSHRAQLQADPFHPGANQALGEYHCFAKSDFEAGLPHLALGADSTLKRLARRDLARPSDVSQQRELASDYQQAAASQPSPAKDCLLKRAAYWTAQAEVGNIGNNIGRWVNSPILPSNPSQTFIQRQWQPGAGAAQQHRPPGASLLITFDQSQVQRSNAPPFTVTLPKGQRVTGQRAILVDASARANHLEGVAVNGGYTRFIGDAWNSQGAPLGLPRRLVSNLNGYTLSTWVRFETNSQFGILLSEPEKANADTPNEAIHWFFNDGNKLDLRQTYPPMADPALKRLKPSHFVTSDLNSARWHFIAITVLPNQTLRWNIDLQTIVLPLRPGQGSKDGITLLAGVVGQIDNLAFYPRPLSAGEVDSLFHMGLTGISLSSAQNDLEDKQTINLPPVLYGNPGEPLAGGPNNNGNNNNDPGNTNNRGNPPAPVASAKRPKPSDEELKEGKKLVMDLFAKDIDKADTAEQKTTLAHKLQSVAQTTDDSMPARYMLFQEAAELLTSCDSLEAWDAWDLLGNEFDTNVIEEKADLIDRLQRKAKAASDQKVLAYRYVGLLNDALKIDDYRLAGILSNKAEICVKKSGDKVLERLVQLGSKDLKQMKSAYTAAEPFKTTLAATPDDKAAAYEWGRYLCLYRGTFDEGLPLLASGGDNPLAKLARQDSTRPGTQALQTALGDAWWDQAETAEDDRSRKMLRGRATHWYKQALPSATGVIAAKLRKRVDDYMAEISPIPLKEAVDVLSMIDVNKHGTVGRWARQGAVIAAISDQQRGTRLSVPVAINGNYDVQVRFDWQGRYTSTPGVTLQLPVGGGKAEVVLGRNPEIALVNNARSRPKVDMSSLALEAGKIYILTASVESDGEQATIKTLLNGRPYVSWTGPITDLDNPSERRGVGFGPPPGFVRPPAFGRPAEPAAASDPTLEISSYYTSDAFAISVLQLKMTSGWAEPLP